MPCAVGVFQGDGDLAGDLGGAPLRHLGFRVDLLFEGRAGDVRHRDKRPAVDLPGVEDGADVGMLQHRRRPGLAHEPLGPLRGFRRVEERYFEGRLPPELGILRQVDRAHATPAEQFQDPVTAELRGQDRKRIRVRGGLAVVRVALLPGGGRFHDEGLEAFRTPDGAAAVGLGHGTTRFAGGIRAPDEDGHWRASGEGEGISAFPVRKSAGFLRRHCIPAPAAKLEAGVQRHRGAPVGGRPWLLCRTT